MAPHHKTAFTEHRPHLTGRRKAREDAGTGRLLDSPEDDKKFPATMFSEQELS